eukprot:UN27498
MKHKPWRSAQSKNYGVRTPTPKNKPKSNQKRFKRSKSCTGVNNRIKESKSTKDKKLEFKKNLKDKIYNNPEKANRLRNKQILVQQKRRRPSVVK